MTDWPAIIGATALLGSSPTAVILSVQRSAARQWADGLESFQLRLSASTDLRQVAEFLRGVSGIIAPRWHRVLAVRGVVLEVVATSSGIRHYLMAPVDQREIVMAHLRGSLPEVGVQDAADYVPPVPTLAGELVMVNRHHALRTSEPGATASALLAALHPLADGEAMIWQVGLFPVGHQSPPSETPPKSVTDKYGHPLFMATARIGVTSASPARDRQLLGRLTGAFHTSNSPTAHFRRRWAPAQFVAADLVRRAVPVLRKPCVLNVEELAGLVAIPEAGTNLPGLNLGGGRRLAPSTDVPRKGRVLADATFLNMDRPLAQRHEDALMHTYAVGPTGSGKSTLLVNAVVQDIAAGFGVVVIDPMGDLVTNILGRIPSHRKKDVVVLDPTDEDRPVGLNLLAGGPEAPELVAEQVLSTFHSLYRASWGPRTADVLRAALLSLVAIPGMTIAEVPLLLSDPAFRRQVVGRLDDPIGLGPFWAWYDGLSEGERSQVIGPVLNKLRAVLVRPRLRRVLGQAQPLLDLDEVVSAGKVLLVPLPAGLLGHDAAELLGALLISRLWQVVEGRAALPSSERRPVFAYIDEFQTFLHTPVPIPDLLARARGLGLGMCLAHQNLGQLDRELQEAVLANCRSRVIFRSSATDARRLAREVPPLEPEDLQALGPYEVVVTITAHGRVTPPVTAKTRPLVATTGDGGSLRQASQQRYGRDAAEVEAELRQRHQLQTADGPLGRRRRAS